MGTIDSAALKIGPLTEEDLDRAAELFERYPYKSAQRAFQKLPPERLVAFYAANLRKDFESDRKRWVAQSGGEPVGLAGLNADGYHTGIYGLKMAKIAPWLMLPDAGCGEAMLEKVEAAARDEGYEHLSARFDGEDFASLHLFESRGFRLIDVSLKFSFPMPGGAAWPETQSPRAGWNIRKMRSHDAEWMVALGGGGHGQNHFLNDPDLDAEATRRLFGNWVQRCIDGLAYTIYVIEDPTGQGRGFVIYLRNSGFAKAVGRNPLILDYVILDPKIRGGGLGPWLVEESLRRENGQGFDYCELRTSQHNHRAVIGYEKLGFRLCASDFIVHRRL